VRRGAIVLCGGRSVRMGMDKATLPFGDEQLLQRIVRIVAQAVSDVVVVKHEEQELPALPPEVRITCDEVDDQGPLGGLIPGLRATRSEAVFLTGCDTPFLKPAFIDRLFDSLGKARIAVAEVDGFAHPLAAVYRTDVLPSVEALLAAGRRRPLYLFNEVSTVRVERPDLEAVDPNLDSLSNLNTPEAYAEALARLRDEGTQ
jgi:molybdopterin-guanine dinucleotide biosynthesis protein A